MLISDFDGTLSLAHGAQRKYMTTFGVTRLFLGKEYEAKATELYNYYYPLEISQKLSDEDRKKFMKEWWERAMELLVHYQFSESIIGEIIKGNYIKPRFALDQLINLVTNFRVPVWVISAGLGDIIAKYFQEIRFLDDINIHSNFLNFDKDGEITGFDTAKCVCNFDKNRSLHKNKIYLKGQKTRQFKIVLGDSIDDVSFIEDRSKAISIGFLEDNEKARIEVFKKNFDIVLTKNQSLEYVNSLIRLLLDN